MSDQDARDLIARLRTASKRIAIMARDEGIKDPSEKRAITWEAADALDRLLRERASLRAQTWQPIETAPKDGTPIIGRLPLDGQIVSVRYWTPEKIAAEEGGHPDEYCGGWYSTSDSSDEYLPKHWIPSPPSPSTIEGEGGR